MRTHTPYLLSAFTAVGVLSAGTASAGIEDVPFFPVTVQESEFANFDYEFVIHNCNDIDVSGIYIETGWNDFFSDSPFDRNIRVEGGPQNFVEGNVSPDLDPWSSSFVSYEVPEGMDGIPAEGNAIIAFVSDGDFGLAELEAALGSDGFGIGLSAFGVGETEGRSYAFTTTDFHDGCLDDDGGDDGGEGDEGDEGDEGVGGDDGPTGVPSPSAALLGLALLGLTAQRRRRDV